VSGTFQITIAREQDVAQIMTFIQELAVYEREPDAVVATHDDLRKALFGPAPKVFAILCWEDDTPIGFALYFFNFSTWLGQHGIYLEDLYVTPSSRGRGAGKLLLQHLAGIAVAEDCGRFEWSVLNWNKPAIDFYESVGARPQSEWMVYRLAGQALEDFACGAG
jgi:GNAT superfamily N-acetyltransferase